MEFKERILQARNNAKMSQEELAKAVGVTRGAVAQWESGETRPRHKTILKISTATETPVSWLENEIGPEGDITLVDEPPKSTPPLVSTVNGAEGIPDGTIPEVDVKGGLGGGGVSIVHQTNSNGMTFAADSVRDYWRLPNWMLTSMNASHADVAAFPVQGDSMMPTIEDGDVVFVDTSHRIPSPDGLYALLDDFGGITVKRLTLTSPPGAEVKTFDVSSDNPEHSVQQRNEDEVHIIGRYLRRFTR